MPRSAGASVASMKLAVFHNYMDNIGGAEIVGLTLAREFKADVFTTNIDRKKIGKMGFTNISLRSIGKVPINPPYRQQMALMRFRLFKSPEDYDCHIIDGDWAMSGAVRNRPNVWYVHAPIREIWDLYDFTRKNNVPAWKRPAFDLWVRYNRHLNLRYVRHVERMVCNSKNTQGRVKRYLKRDAKVVYPPIESKRFKFKKSGDFWLSVNRLISHKRVDIQLRAFAKLPKERLVVVGSYEQSRHFKTYAGYLEGIRPQNVKILNWVSNPELLNLYSTCKGFVTTAKDEDFGMTPVEAMASGKPVVAANEGGYKETVIDGVTGSLIDNINPDRLVNALKKVGKDPERYKEACLKRASEFDTRVFVKEMKEVLKDAR